jgi:hypothetical protein
MQWLETIPQLSHYPVLPTYYECFDWKDTGD